MGTVPSTASTRAEASFRLAATERLALHCVSLQQDESEFVGRQLVHAVVVEVVLQVSIAAAKQLLLKELLVVHEVEGVEDIKAKLKCPAERERSKEKRYS